MHITFSNTSHLGGLAMLGSIFVVLFWIATAIVHIVLADAVYNDAHKISETPERDLFFLGNGLWSLATLLGGIFVAAIYWAIHHSTLNLQVARSKNSESDLPDSGKN